MTKRVKRFWTPAAVAAVALAVSAALAGCGSQTGQTASSGGGGGGGGGSNAGTPVNVAVSLTATSLPSYVAAHKGFFAKNGLDAKLTKVENKTNLVDGLGHNFDFGLTYMPVVISAQARGLEIVAVSGSNVGGPGSNGDLELMVAPGSKITDVKQLNGKRIGAGTVNGVTHLMTLAWLQQEGVDVQSTKGIALPIATMADQLKAGRIDAAEATEPFITQMKQQGFKSLGDPENEVLEHKTALSIWAASKPWADQHKDLVKGFQKAQEEAIDWITANPDEANQILSEEIGVPIETVKSAPPLEFKADVTPEDFAPFIKMETEVGWLKADVSASQLVV